MTTNDMLIVLGLGVLAYVVMTKSTPAAHAGTAGGNINTNPIQSFLNNFGGAQSPYSNLPMGTATPGMQMGTATPGMQMGTATPGVVANPS